jgi:membrane fusion protein (multidrug efflux system)
VKIENIAARRKAFETSMDDRVRAEQAYGHDALGDEVLLGDPSEMVLPAAAPETGDRRVGKPRLRNRLLLGGLVVLLVAGLFLYLRGGRYEATDDAAVMAGQGAVAANVSGPVIAIAVHENQSVKAGQILFRIDPQPYQAAVDEAAAQLADARAQVESRRATYQQGEAGVQAAQARLAYAISEAARQKELLAEGISSQNQYDQAVLAVETARQDVQTSTQQAASVRAQLTGDAAAPTDRQPAVQAAQAALDRARLNLGYTIVRAAQDGIVTRVDQLQPGNYVAASKPVFTLVGRRIWIEANFKESQLHYMRIGQPATVTIDAFLGRTLNAHVVSFSPGTGNSFSLLPAENATGNWVKVVQRLPVQLDFDRLPADLPTLHAGLSAQVSVDTGHVRHIFGGGESAAPAR